MSRKEWYRYIGSLGGKKGVKNPRKGFGGLDRESQIAAIEKMGRKAR